MSKGYDEKCMELAVHFLGKSDETEAYITALDSLAQAIQDAVEDWFLDKDKLQA